MTAKPLNFSLVLIPEIDFLRKIPRRYDVPFEEMLTLTEKQNEVICTYISEPKRVQGSNPPCSLFSDIENQ